MAVDHCASERFRFCCWVEYGLLLCSAIYRSTHVTYVSLAWNDLQRLSRVHETHMDAAKDTKVVRDSSCQSLIRGFRVDQAGMVLMFFPPHLEHLNPSPTSGTGRSSGQLVCHEKSEAGVPRLEVGMVDHWFDLHSTLCRPVGAELVFEENAD
jgi:hypothetical protein